MDRREMITGLSAALSATFVGASVRAETPATKPATKPLAKPAGKPAPAAAPLTPALRAVIESTAHCRDVGEVCLAHCTDKLAAGQANMASCQRSVMNMLASVEAMHKIASYHSANATSIQAMARACAELCRACEAACAPHVSHHVECKQCAEACAACAKACEQLAVS